MVHSLSQRNNMNKLKLSNTTLPQYSMTLPVSKMQVKFRPFLVKEEKVLLIALQSKNVNEINNAMSNVILSCTNDTIDTKRLCAADAEYAFLQIRSKSVGEEAKPQVVCSKCGHATSVKIKLDQITIAPQDKEPVDSNIKITDTLSIVMKYPSIHDIDYEKNEVEIAFELAKKCIESVIIDGQVYEQRDIDPQELSSFIDNLLPEQFKSIMDFLQTIPELKYEFRYPCPNCGESVLVQIKSVSDFFQ